MKEMWNDTKGEQDNLCLALINPRLCKKLSIKELEQLREMSGTIQGCGYGEKIGTNPNINLEVHLLKLLRRYGSMRRRLMVRLIDW